MLLGFCFTLGVVGAAAQSSSSDSVAASASAAVAPSVPQQVRFTGQLAGRASETVEAVFRVYAAAEGGEPLWSETQRVAIGADGGYAVLLGNGSAQGLPQSVFAAGQARWLGVSVEQAAELPRTELSSVFYAMKSADAETLAGHSAAEFVTQAQLGALADSASVASTQQSAATPQLLNATPTGSGTAGTVPLWTSSTALGNSEIVQGTSGIGINNATPATTLDVGGATTLRGTVALPSAGLATTAAGTHSPLLELSASSWSTTAASPVPQNFAWLAAPTGNNTASPSGVLDLLFGSGTSPLVSTGFSIETNGHINFVPGQIFPGAGTITAVAAASPLSGGGGSGLVTLGLNLTALEPMLNTYFARLNASNSFVGSEFITGSLSASLLTTAGGGLLSNGAVTVEPKTAATAAAAVNSPLLEVGASAYSSTTTAAVPQNFAWQTVATGNNTASPAANLALLYGSGTAAPAATGLSIAPNGAINFSPSQTFPITGTGGGTITAITTASPLTGGGTSGAVALGLNTGALESTLNTVYPRLAFGNIFSSYLEAYQTSGPGNAALLGWGSSGSVGVFGDSDTGYGIQGESTSGFGVYSQVTTPAAGSAGVLGFTGKAFSTSYSSESGIADAGVWADTSAAGTGIPVALFATGDDAYGEAIVTNGADYPSIFADNNGGTAAEFESSTGYGVSASTNTGTGVYGSTSGGGNGVEGLASSTPSQDAGVLGIANLSSTTYGAYNIYAGVWGDTGTSSTTVAPAWAIGVLGTADDGHAGVFLNNSSSWSTLYVSNAGSGGTGQSVGLFKTLMASSSDGTCGIGSGGSLSCTGPIKGLVSAGGGARTVETYSVQSPENWMEDFGSAELHAGAAVVTIDSAFAETVTGDASYHVFLTANGDSKGLYVTAKTATTFEVRESGGGKSSLSFDYRIVAKRRGFEAQRLVDVTERFNAEQRAGAMAMNSGIQHKPLALARSPLATAFNNHTRRVVPSRMIAPVKPSTQPANTPHP